jgi:hypothetical protein
LEDVALVAGTQKNLSNLYSLDIYGVNSPKEAMPSTNTITFLGSFVSKLCQGKVHCTIGDIFVAFHYWCHIAM